MIVLAIRFALEPAEVAVLGAVLVDQALLVVPGTAGPDRNLAAGMRSSERRN
jgi:hypothetical protein